MRKIECFSPFSLPYSKCNFPIKPMTMWRYSRERILKEILIFVDFYSVFHPQHHTSHPIRCLLYHRIDFRFYPHIQGLWKLGLVIMLHRSWWFTNSSSFPVLFLWCCQVVQSLYLGIQGELVTRNHNKFCCGLHCSIYMEMAGLKTESELPHFSPIRKARHLHPLLLLLLFNSTHCCWIICWWTEREKAGNGKLEWDKITWWKGERWQRKGKNRFVFLLVFRSLEIILDENKIFFLDNFSS